MNEQLSQRLNKFNETITDALILASIARGSDLQREMIAKLSQFTVTLEEWKQEAIAEGNEDRANLFLGMECCVKAVQAELNMWLLLKAEEPESAWDSLIDAQTATSHAVRAHSAFADLEDRAKHLDAIEHIVFPPQVFLSAGLIVPKSICSICNTDYEDCVHLVGKPYWGKFCFRELRNVTADHISFVDEPANKRCRVTHFSAEGGKRNRMTWRVEGASASSPNQGDEKSLTATGVLLADADLKRA